MGDAGNSDDRLRERRLETEKKGECECECLGVKKFQMERSFVLADGSSLGDAGSSDSGLRERQKNGTWRQRKRESVSVLGVKKF